MQMKKKGTTSAGKMKKMRGGEEPLKGAAEKGSSHGGEAKEREKK